MPITVNFQAILQISWSELFEGNNRTANLDVACVASGSIRVFVSKGTVTRITPIDEFDFAVNMNVFGNEANDISNLHSSVSIVSYHMRSNLVAQILDQWKHTVLRCK